MIIDFLFILILGLIALYDYKKKVIPNFVTITLCIATLILLISHSQPIWLAHIFPALITYLILFIFSFFNKLGGGDVKLVSVIVLYLGLTYTLIFLVSLFCILIITHVIFRHKSIMPLGPIIAIGATIAVGYKMFFPLIV